MVTKTAVGLQFSAVKIFSHDLIQQSAVLSGIAVGPTSVVFIDYHGFTEIDG